MQNTNLDTIKAKALEEAAKTKSSNWFTHTRKWNLVFASVMSLGIGSSFALDTLKLDQPYGLISSLLFWITLFLGPMLLKMFDDVKYLKGKTFITSDNRKIHSTKDAPEFKFACFLSIGLVLLVGSFLKASDTLGMQAIDNFRMISCIIFLFSSFFIYKNCPISIILHLKYWQSQPHQPTNTKSPYTRYSGYGSTSRSITSDPSYSSLSCNVFNKHR